MSALRGEYVTNGWLEQPARGIYKCLGAGTQWQHLVVSLQSLLRTSVVVGGLTALELQGYGHYVPMGELRKIYLCTAIHLPNWPCEVDPTIQFQARKAKTLFKSGAISKAIKVLPPLASTRKYETTENPDDGLRLHVWATVPGQR